MILKVLVAHICVATSFQPIVWMNPNIYTMYFIFNWETFQLSFCIIASMGIILMHIFATFNYLFN